MSYLHLKEFDLSERDLVAAHKIDPTNRAVNEKLGQVKQVKRWQMFVFNAPRHSRADRRLTSTKQRVTLYIARGARYVLRAVESGSSIGLRRPITRRVCRRFAWTTSTCPMRRR